MLRRGGVVAVLGAGIVAAAAGPAAADGWGWTDCEQNPHPGCELGAGRGESGGGGGPAPGPGTGTPPPSGGGTGGGSGGEEAVSPDCFYERADDYQPAPGTQPAAAHDRGDGEAARRGVAPAVFHPAQETGEDGAWYVWRCTDNDVRDAYYRPPVWIPDAEEPEAQGPSAAAVAERAYEQLRLPEPQVAASPAGDQLVTVPTWLWLEGWEPVSATASAGGVEVTATARPQSVEWDMGDGTTVTCDGPGTPYRDQGDPAEPSPDCGHTYRTSSAGQQGEAFPVSARVTWTVSWSGAGQEGTFPGLVTETSTSFRVLESQALTR